MDTIDLERYPIDQPGSEPYRRLLERCQADLVATGACVLDGFMKPECLPAVVAEVEPNLGNAFYKTKRHSPYLIKDDDAFGPDHPRNRKQTTDSATLAYDWIPDDSVLNGLYIVGLDDSSEERLVEGVTHSPAWSSLGRYIAFVAQEFFGERTDPPIIRLFDRTTREVTDLGPGSQPAWQPQS